MMKKKRKTRKKLQKSTTDRIDREIQKINQKMAYQFKDSDKDGVINIFDCQPYNPKKQGVEPNVELVKRLDRLPLYVTDRPMDPSEPRRLYHITSKEAKKKAPKARKRALSAIKKHPDLVGKIEKRRPSEVIVTSAKDKEGYAGKAWPLGHYKAEKGRRSGSGSVLVRAVSAKKYKRYRKEDRADTGVTLAHELEHIKQYRKYKGQELARKRKGEYEDRPLEREAHRAEQRFYKKHYKPVSEEEKEKKKKGMLHRFRVIVGAEKGEDEKT